MKKIIIVILVCLTQTMLGQVAWQQSPPVKAPIKKVVVDGITYELKSDHPKELEILIAVKKLKKGDELSREQILTIYEIVLRRVHFVVGTRVYYGRFGVCADLVAYAYDGLYPPYSISKVYNPIGIFVENADEEVPLSTCDPIPGMPVYWLNKNDGHIAIVVSLEKSDLGHDWYILTYYDQNSGGRKIVGLATKLIIKDEFCTFVKTYPYF